MRSAHTQVLVLLIAAASFACGDDGAAPDDDGPSDSGMRTILDPVDPETLRPLFK